MMQDAGVFMVPTQYTILSGARRDEGDALWAALPEHSRRKMQKYRGALLDAAEHLAASDVRIAFGTDAGMFPHQDNWREFPMMVSTGISPLRALRAATSAAAELLQLDDLGVIAEGKIADLIAMPGDPFAALFSLKWALKVRRPSATPIQPNKRSSSPGTSAGKLNRSAVSVSAVKSTAPSAKAVPR